MGCVWSKVGRATASLAAGSSACTACLRARPARPAQASQWRWRWWRATARACSASPRASTMRPRMPRPTPARCLWSRGRRRCRRTAGRRPRSPTCLRSCRRRRSPRCARSPPPCPGRAGGPAAWALCRKARRPFGGGTDGGRLPRRRVGGRAAGRGPGGSLSALRFQLRSSPLLSLSLTALAREGLSQCGGAAGAGLPARAAGPQPDQPRQRGHGRQHALHGRAAAAAQGGRAGRAGRRRAGAAAPGAAPAAAPGRCPPRGARERARDGRSQCRSSRRGRRGAGARGVLPNPDPDARRRAPQAKATVYVGAEKPPRVAELAVGPLPAPGNHSLLRALAWDLRPPTRMEYSLCAPRCPAALAGARAGGQVPYADRCMQGPVHDRARSELVACETGECGERALPGRPRPAGRPAARLPDAGARARARMDAVVDRAAAQLAPLMNASFGGFTYHNCTPPLCLFWRAPAAPRLFCRGLQLATAVCRAIGWGPQPRRRAASMQACVSMQRMCVVHGGQRRRRGRWADRRGVRAQGGLDAARPCARRAADLDLVHALPGRLLPAPGAPLWTRCALR